MYTAIIKNRKTLMEIAKNIGLNRRLNLQINSSSIGPINTTYQNGGNLENFGNIG